MMTPLAVTIVPLGRTYTYATAPLFPTTLSGNGLSLWVRAASLATTMTDNDPVGSFTELGPLGLTFTANGAVRPIWKANVLNGKPVFRFDGVDDFLLSSGSMTIQEVWAVANHSTTPFSGYRGLINGSSTNWLIGNINTTNLYTSGGISTLVNNVATSQFSVLATFKTAAAHRASAYTETVKIGDQQNYGRFWQGDIAEIVACSRVLSASERTQLQAYFASEYGI